MLASAACAAARNLGGARRTAAAPIVGAARTFWADVPMAPKVIIQKRVSYFFSLSQNPWGRGRHGSRAR
jgi:hypothetical protein